MKQALIAMLIGAAAAMSLGTMASQDGSLAVSSSEEAGSESLAQDDTAKTREETEKARQDALKARAEAEKARGRALKEKERVLRIIGNNRPRLGIIVETEGDTETDAIGALVQAVTPGGPADQAGLKAGDIIVKFNGKKLAGPNPEADEDESAPAQTLLTLARQLKDGDKVSLEYRRGKGTGTASVIAKAMEEKNIRVFVDTDLPDMDFGDFNIPEIPGDFLISLEERAFDMELVGLNPDLGEYFGTPDGLLVVRAPADSPLKLKGGDVILKIGDRKPTSPSQALRILRSYESGEAVPLEVMRKRQKVNLAATIPAHKGTDKFEWHGKAPEAPVPPTPPSPPSAPAPPAPTSWRSAVAPAHPTTDCA